MRVGPAHPASVVVVVVAVVVVVVLVVVFRLGISFFWKVVNS